eukprot:CAMPEP_0170740974 /NCGR_PEP_ID=MMETSP0437-20130122/5972_1 /TAXON_ID=0 /ORGANISM="Sexangularia sp." /LENGTH=148 /DNA_ID=CAMNT_0011079515 /DNA_START=70 /DNA_END=516 /DNA_ORIENTATION=+
MISLIALTALFSSSLAELNLYYANTYVSAGQQCTLNGPVPQTIGSTPASIGLYLNASTLNDYEISFAYDGTDTFEYVSYLTSLDVANLQSLSASSNPGQCVEVYKSVDSNGACYLQGICYSGNSTHGVKYGRVEGADAVNAKKLKATQ